MLVIPSLGRGGAERVVSLLSQEWSRSHEVVIGVFDASATAYGYGGRLIGLDLAAQDGLVNKAKNALSRIGMLRKLFRQEQPDHIISFMESSNFPAIIAAALSGKLGRLTVSVRNDPARFPVFYRALIPLLYRFPARVVAVSAGVKDALARMGVPAERLRSIPNPVVMSAKLDIASSQCPGFPNRFVLAVGRLHPQKGYDRLLHAFARLDSPGLDLVILGEGSERPALIQLASDLGLKDRVHLLGSVPDPEAWYQRAVCFVLSSRHEGWPNVLMEAMACGCPVVSFDCDYGPAEIIEDGVSGLLVEEGDVAALGAAVQRTLNDRSLRDGLAAGGKQRAAMFRVEVMAGYWTEER